MNDNLHVGIMESIRLRINKPYPYTARFSSALKTILFISWFIFFFVYFFRSESFINNNSITIKLLYSFYFGFVTFLVSSVNILIFGLIVKPEDEKNWVVWKEIILYVVHFITISVAIHFLSLFVMEKELTFLGIFNSVFGTTLIGLIPVSIHVLHEQKKLFKKHYELAKQITDDSVQRTIPEHKEKIKIMDQVYSIDDLYFIESNKNYLNIYLPDNKMETIRLTIKEMENMLSIYPQFIRCHRAYIINADKIKDVEGNAQGLKIFLNDQSSFVPVSRSYIPKIDHAIRPIR